MAKIFEFKSPHVKIKQALNNKPELLEFYNELLYIKEYKPFLYTFKNKNLSDQDIIDVMKLAKDSKEGKVQMNIDNKTTAIDLVGVCQILKEIY